ncbi:GNAT family N-acetyltransferase [Pedobacter sp. MC2016-15]|uniref:GNAT family N-acetyltransferase n=1 Tax=Pedobacter sp. MC2016-15 TaxID=2994473 RepID=UPI002247976D|nr:GNAT family N-acetyltransferase [Pedobacter sp. MC2016-15]MCX2477544.1 GNAT family N-acetyltransferase [Pedobacter sp. MC2016-15]
MRVIHTSELTNIQKKAIMKLWNNEYPDQLNYRNLTDLNSYLATLPGAMHFLCVRDAEILGWAFKFSRDAETWFAIILDSKIHKQGVGTMLLDILKADENALTGWVVDHDRYLKINGDAYPSPLNFYLKNGFGVNRQLRLESAHLSAAMVKWQARPVFQV